MKEIWLDVKKDPKYEVSNLGNVRNKETGRILKPQLNKEGGYYRVTLGNRQRDYIHRIVADTFYDGDHSDLEVNHIDGNKLNNSISNLEYCSKKENIRHAFGKDSRLHVVRCKNCRNRYKYDLCENKDDDFFCGYGYK